MTTQIVVLVNYKSGTQIRMMCDEFTINRNALGAMIAVKWKNPTPKPLDFNIDAVESIWRVK